MQFRGPLEKGIKDVAFYIGLSNLLGLNSYGFYQNLGLIAGAAIIAHNWTSFSKVRPSRVNVCVTTLGDDKVSVLYILIISLIKLLSYFDDWIEVFLTSSKILSWYSG